MRKFSKFLAVLAVAAIIGCGSSTPTPAGSGATGAADSAGGTGSDGSTGGTKTDTATGTGSGIDAAVAAGVAKDELKVAITVLGAQALLKGQLLTPSTCTDANRCPLVVVVGDYDGSPYPDYVPGAQLMAGALNVVVAVFNLPGLGAGSAKSEGEDDVGGVWHQTAVKEVMHLKASAKGVDSKKLGYITIGTGILPVTKALKTFGSTGTLADVKFVIDVEGPMDRCSISQAPADDAAGIGPSDGPGASDSACHFSSTGGTHAAQYPPKSATKPASIVCSSGAWPITKTGQGCNDNSWWTDRDPYGALKGAYYRYQRLQFTYDHRLPSYWASRLAIQAVAASQSKYFQLNNMEPCGAAWSDEDCKGQPCWLDGPYGNGLPPAPYSEGKLVKVTPDALFTQVLPGYVQRMLDTQTNKDCH